MTKRKKENNEVMESEKKWQQLEIGEIFVLTEQRAEIQNVMPTNRESEHE